MKSCFLFLFVVICLPCVYAQDVSFTQFYNNKQYLNPAYAGAEAGYRVASSYRNQWSPNLPGGFNTNSVSGDWNIAKKDAGIGAVMMYDKQGSNVINTASFLLNFQKRLKLYDRYYHKLDLHFGIQTGFVTKTLNWNNLVFSDQLDAVAGVVNGSAATPPTTPTKNYADFGTGVVLRFRGPDVHHDFGVAVGHLSQPNQSFYGAENRLPMKVTLHYIGMIPIRHFFGKEEKDFSFSPVALASTQGYFREYDLGGIFTKDFLFCGTSYRFRRVDASGDVVNTAVLLAGFKKVYDQNYILRFTYSYDITVSGLRSYVGGAHELSLLFEFDPNQKGKRQREKIHRSHGR